MLLRLAAACLVFLWTAGLAAEAEQCHGNPGALGTSWVITLDTSEHHGLGSMQFEETLPLNDQEVVLTFDDGPSALYTPRVLANGDYPRIATKAEQWAITLEASAGAPVRWAEWPSPWLLQTIRSSLLAAKAEQWAITFEASAGTSLEASAGSPVRLAEWARPWLVQAIRSSLPAAKAAHASASKLSTVSLPASTATRHLEPWKIASLPSGQE
jgi:hypothetical protein